jgi:predicted AlkP superfamily pyrophosphatase or phosphodiesterase
MFSKRFQYYFTVLFSITISLFLFSCNSLSKKAINSEPENYLILISFDGFRWDYMNKTDTPNLDRLVKAGVKADALIPSFPSKTFPNHYTITTGLYPENHGIVANTMYDPVFDATFSLGNREEVQNGRWWGGEPIWVTAENQGLKTLCNFWPGSEAEINGVRPTYWIAYDGNVPNIERVETVLRYLDKPAKERPSFYTIYFSDPDDYGHMGGPDSSSINVAIQECDARVGQLIAGLEKRDLFDKVNIMIVSDHGMAQLSQERLIFLDDYLDPTNLKMPNWSPVMDIWCKDSEVDSIFNLISEKHPNFSVYKKQGVPEQLHFSNNRRIAPIIGIMDNGWTLTSHDYYAEHQSYYTGGTHGFDPANADMHAFFLAHGPAFKSGTTIPAFENIQLYNLMARVLEIESAENDGDVELVKDILVQ